MKKILHHNFYAAFNLKFDQRTNKRINSIHTLVPKLTDSYSISIILIIQILQHLFKLDHKIFNPKVPWFKDHGSIGDRIRTHIYRINKSPLGVVLIFLFSFPICVQQ